MEGSGQVQLKSFAGDHLLDYLQCGYISIYISLRGFSFSALYFNLISIS